MNEPRLLRDRFWASSSWPWWKHLLVAAAVLLTIGLFLSLFTRRDDSISPPSAVEPRPAASQRTTEAPAATDNTPISTQGSGASTTQQSSTSSQPTSTLSATSSSGNALSILATIPIEREQGAGYNRDLFAVWLDADGDGCGTREEVFVAESLSPVQPGPGGCSVSAAEWYSIYDGQTTTNPSTFDVDHVVSLKEAWDSGAWNWEPSRRIAFGNDLTDSRTLVAVSAVSNRSKGDADPSNWLPMDEQICQYLADWIAIKARWSLSMDESEHGRIRNMLRRDCPSTNVEDWPLPPT